MSSDPDLLQDPLLAQVPVVDGRKVLGSCALVSRLGQGGMGAVYVAHHQKLDLDVALKCLKPGLATDTESVSRFIREARIAARISSENLIRVFEVDQAHGLHYLVMELVRGETVRQRVARKGALSPTEALTIIRASARGLAAAHRHGVVHRDIKPDNILISTSGEVKVADLGLAKGLETTTVTMAHMVMGTPQYMAPEQWEDTRAVGPAGDVFALGMTLYYALTARSAFEGDSHITIMRKICDEPLPDITRRVDGLDPRIVAILDRCARKDPDERYQDAAQLLEALDEIGGFDSLSPDQGDAGAGNAADRTRRSGLVSPPPAAGTRPGGEARSERGSPGGKEALVTVVPGRRPGLLSLAVVILLLAGGGFAAHSTGLLQRWFGTEVARTPEQRPDPTPPTVEKEPAPTDPPGPALPVPDPAVANPDAPNTTTTPQVAPRPRPAEEAFDRAQRSLDQGRYPEAIVDLKATLSLEPSFPLAREKLALAYRRSAEELRGQGRPGRSLALARLSHETLASSDARDLASGLEDELRERLLKSLRIASPPAGSLIESAPLAVTGSAPGETLKLVSVAGIEARLSGDAFEVQVETLDDGPVELRIEVTTALGITASTTLPLSVAIDAGRAFRAAERALTTGDLDTAIESYRTVLSRKSDFPGARSRLQEAHRRKITQLRDGGELVAALECLEGAEPDLEAPTFAALGEELTRKLRTQLQEAFSIEAPSPDSYVTEIPFTVRGSAGPVVATIEILGAPGDVPVVHRRDDAFWVEIPRAPEGPLSLQLSARGPRGVTVSRGLALHIDTEKPRLFWDEPHETDRVFEGNVVLRGRVEDGSPCRVILGERSVAVAASKWELTLPLDAGDHTIVIEAVDAADRRTSVERTLRVRTPPPPAPPGLTYRDVNPQGYHEYTLDQDPDVHLILVPALQFRMGSETDPLADRDEKPAHDIDLDSFFIAKTETTNAQYRRFCRATGRTRPPDPKWELESYFTNPKYAQHPVVDITYDDAVAYCRWAGLELPTEARWEAAARGTDRRIYPWGNTQPSELGPAGANYSGYSSFRDWQKGCRLDSQGKLLRRDGFVQLNPQGEETWKRDGHKWTSPVGSHAAGTGPFGTVDQAGNVWEWCRDIYGRGAYGQPYRAGDGLRDSTQEFRRVSRGGDFTSYGKSLRAANRFVTAPDYRSWGLGMRPVRDAKSR